MCQLRMTILGAIAVALLLCVIVVSAVPVRVFAFEFAQQYTKKGYLIGFPVKILETGQQWITGEDGRITVDFPVGSNLTFFMPEFRGYSAMQSAIVTIPPGGLNTPFTEVTMQMFPKWLYEFCLLVIPGKKNMSACQVLVTVCGVNKSWDVFPQGMPGCMAHLHPPLSTKTFYFGTFAPYSNHTNPFPNNLTSTSWDGGVLFENIPVMPGKEFVITASKPGYTFSSTRVRCDRPGTLINAAPNQGPRANPSS